MKVPAASKRGLAERMPMRSKSSRRMNAARASASSPIRRPAIRDTMFEVPLE
ncbi:MAG: hypothetical protein ABFS41_00165 [Myxococcota bacterium]